MKIFLHKFSAMTLVEILVVLAIISILGGLLYPSVNRSRQVAKTIKCLSNLHQIGIAVQTYVTDNGQKMPSLQNRGFYTNAGSSLDNALLLPGDTNSAVFQCPSDYKKLYAVTGTSYFWNFTVNGQDVQGLFSIVGGTDPSLIPLVSDKEGFHPDVKDRVNVLYADGRVTKDLKFVTNLPPEP